jgi:dipeptidyl aminopeptidase/acylaminoacyl peptidase
MTPEDVYELTGAADPRVAPDGDRVAYVVTRIDRETNDYGGTIWLARADGSGEPRRLTAGTKRDASPRWSPDGTRIAFASNRDGDTAQLYVIPVDGGEAIKLTSFKESPSEAAWSPDGTRIAFCARVRDDAYDEEDDRKRRPRRFTRLLFKLDNEGWIGDRRKHVFVVPADGSAEPTQLTTGDFEHGSPAWSPDGTRIAVAAAREDDWDLRASSDVYVFPLDGGEPTRLTEGGGASSSPSWSPDGSRIAFQFTPGLFDEPHHTQIAVVAAAGGEPRILTDVLDRNCAPYPSMREPVWLDDDRILFPVEDGGNTHLYAVPADGSDKPEAVVDGELNVTGFDYAAGVGVHTATDPTHLSELFVGDARLTSVGDAFRSSRDLSAPERFTATSPDGAQVDAWIMRPAGFEPGKRYPVLLNIHGGPYGQYGNRFFDEFQVQTGAGYVVVFSNPRGSSGGDEAWARAIRGPGEAGPGMGSVDYDDLMAVTDEALRRFGFCDPDRVGVLGGSYGGFMTSWIVGHTNRFKAAVSERAVNSWVSMWGSSDIGWAFKGYVGAGLHDDYEAWRAMSPHVYAPNIATPLLIMHSENDLRCNIEQAEQLFTTLRLLKREVEFVRFPAESHELSRSGAPAHRVMRFEIILDWFGRYLR